MNISEKEYILVLYDKDDVEELNKIEKNQVKKIYLFSPGLEKILINKDKYQIYGFDEIENLKIQQEIIISAKKIYKEFENNENKLNGIDEGLIENIHNIFFVSIFSFIYLVENIKKFKNFCLIKNNKIKKFDNLNDFSYQLIQKIIEKKNQGFFQYVKPKSISLIKSYLIKLNNLFCYSNSKKKIIVVGSLLSKKVKLFSKGKSIFEIKVINDFKFYHIISNFFTYFNILKKNKKFIFFPEENYLTSNIINDKLKNFVFSFKDNNIDIFKDIIFKILKDYCVRQTKIKNSIEKLINKSSLDKVFVDQLRFGVATVLANLCKQKNIDVILVPHGSVSEPDSEISDFVLKICGRGLIFSNLASHVVSQSKISFNAIKYFQNDTKIYKSSPILYGKNKLISKYPKDEFTFLHASTPKSLNKWPWIYENYSEYVENLKTIIYETAKFKKIKLIIRFREGPECDLKTFIKLIELKKNKHVHISNNKSFFDDLKLAKCLISFSSTSIEETLCLNKQVMIFSKYKNYKHINFPLDQMSIIYANKDNLASELKKILKNKIIINNNILWDQENLNNNIFS